jgi:glycerol-1-phosphate dehydrogenase [NAD(P)+]
MSANTISVPALVRVKPGALDRLGLYLARAGRVRVAIMHSCGLKPELLKTRVG